MESRIKTVMAAILGVNSDTVNEASSMENIYGWDSLKNIKLVLALEEEFDVEFNEDEVVMMINYQRIKHILEQKKLIE